MAREPTRRAEPEPKATEPAKAAATPTEAAATPAAETAAPGAERPKISLKIGKASTPAVYAKPYGSELASFDPKTGSRIAPPSKSAA
jgi:hypothetical protein